MMQMNICMQNASERCDVFGLLGAPQGGSGWANA
jgi:hypothetical protein